LEQIIRRYLENLRRTQYLPPEQLLLHQRELLDLLVRHARAHVPFYRDTGRLNVLFRRDDAIDWERWSQIPP
jgi:phenylacetate-CoA ligase